MVEARGVHFLHTAVQTTQDSLQRVGPKSPSSKRCKFCLSYLLFFLALQLAARRSQFRALSRAGPTAPCAVAGARWRGALSRHTRHTVDLDRARHEGRLFTGIAWAKLRGTTSHRMENVDMKHGVRAQLSAMITTPTEQPAA